MEVVLLYCMNFIYRLGDIKSFRPLRVDLLIFALRYLMNIVH